MEFILGKILKIIGAKKMLLLVWGMIDSHLKEYVANTNNKYDDDVLKLIEEFINDFAA